MKKKQYYNEQDVKKLKELEKNKGCKISLSERSYEDSGPTIYDFAPYNLDQQTDFPSGLFLLLLIIFFVAIAIILIGS